MHITDQDEVMANLAIREKLLEADIYLYVAVANQDDIGGEQMLRDRVVGSYD